MAVVTRPGTYIGGEWVPGDGEEIEVRSPATGELLGSVFGLDGGSGRCRGRARPRMPSTTGAGRPLLERVELCRRAFEICTERAEELAQMITREVGKTIRESREEMIEYTADHFRRASEDVLRHAGQVLPSTQERSNDKRIIVVQEPVGVVAAISPWNFPVDIAGIPIVYGLAVGCTVVWKPSEHAPLCANMFAEVIHDAGFPPGTLNVVHGRGEVGSALVRHPDVASVVFTGSSETGRAGRARRRAQEPRARARRQRPADRPRGRGSRQGRRRGDRRAASTSPASAAPLPSASSSTSR